MTTPFIIYALPRSKTFWTSKFLSRGLWKCGHDELRYVRGMDDIKSLLAIPGFGSAETAAAPFWRLIQQMRPDIKTAVIRRPVQEVIESMLRTGVEFDQLKLAKAMRRLDAKLDQIEARVPGVLSVRFDEMNDEGACAQLWAHCTGTCANPDWFAQIAPLNLQCDLELMMRYAQAHMPQMERVGRLVKQRMLQKLSSRRVSSEGMTYQQEPFDQWLRDAQPLFGQHLIEVGERPDAWTEKNLELMRVLEKIGALYVTTARSNGRMFGYLMSIVAPALDSAFMDAVQTTFYVSPDALGIGLKLQRASIEFLRQKGVNGNTCFRDGTRGESAGRMGALFKRLGAEYAGDLYTLDMKGSA